MSSKRAIATPGYSVLGDAGMPMIDTARGDLRVARWATLGRRCAQTAFTASNIEQLKHVPSTGTETGVPATVPPSALARRT